MRGVGRGCRREGIDAIFHDSEMMRFQTMIFRLREYHMAEKVKLVVRRRYSESLLGNSQQDVPICE
jgi:hypothetical protein